ncbi:hypothetical protein AMTR_s00012p00264080 [Amborella trichopoda]|uniref:Uncharacterized protein n=1 Tax=Amborella trichopoda TaxID=13333 RepID=W1PDP8_AMBTC|nr:hypothetical protein AMTR_s00012p00264080 [Amborella trichopoda]
MAMITTSGTMISMVPMTMINTSSAVTSMVPMAIITTSSAVISGVPMAMITTYIIWTIIKAFNFNRPMILTLDIRHTANRFSVMLMFIVWLMAVYLFTYMSSECELCIEVCKMLITGQN